MLEEEAEKKAEEVNAKPERDYFCPLTKMKCQTNCQCYGSAQAINPKGGSWDYNVSPPKFKYKDDSAWQVQPGYCTAYCLIGPLS